jgi:hypothetical protein
MFLFVYISIQLRKKLCRVYIPIFCIFALFYEFLQISEKINGTFDPSDICFIVFAVVFEICLARKCGFQKVTFSKLKFCKS